MSWEGPELRSLEVLAVGPLQVPWQSVPTVVEGADCEMENRSLGARWYGKEALGPELYPRLEHGVLGDCGCDAGDQDSPSGSVLGIYEQGKLLL